MGDVHLKGLAELQRFLDQLPAKMERNVLRGAVRAGARVFVEPAKANIRNVSGETAEKIKVSTRAKGGKVSATVGSRHYTAAMLEFGTRPHEITPRRAGSLNIGGNLKERVQHPGARPHPWLRPAVDVYSHAAVYAIGDYIRLRLATKHGLDTSDVLFEGDE